MQSNIRVISGSAKFKKLKIPRSSRTKHTRPITDRVKSALFSILIGQIDTKTQVLDLFAGSGQLGIEALSRGARHAVFVEVSEKAINTLKENLFDTNLKERSTIYKERVEHFLNTRQKEYEDHISSFKIIFIEPPYDETSDVKYQDLIHLSKDFLTPGGIIIMRHPSDIKLREEEDLVLADSRKYGKNTITFFVLPFKSK